MLKKLLAWLGREPLPKPPPDPTAMWSAARPLPLTLRIPDGRLNDLIALGDSYQVLSLLGRPSNPHPYDIERFEYPTLGLVVEGGGGNIEYFEFIVQPETFDRNVTPAQVTLCLADGRRFLLDGQTDEAVIAEHLGPPTERDADEEEIIVHYRLEGRSLEWEFTAHGKAKRFHVERLMDSR
ncbi:MAG: hypothetical protein SNJ67_06120 [Chloracidobacterium sp.]|uniref:Uncharacterized protein n=1 Tax=Chloracidobacterium validum TaxID=2821543 RepID=A0ABX8BFF1_9BACT|nr:hypothetical protein [Chloracidobacterium validum]QUW04348.1 hypothetical protein J8C06_15045 [Chloracidobacterium validum]